MPNPNTRPAQIRSDLFMVDTHSVNHIIHEGVKTSPKAMEIISNVLLWAGVPSGFILLADWAIHGGPFGWVLMAISGIMLVVRGVAWVWAFVRRESQRYKREELEQERMRRQLNRK